MAKILTPKEFDPIQMTKTNLDLALRQTVAMKNYFTMMESYLQTMQSGFNFWFSMYGQRL